MPKVLLSKFPDAISSTLAGLRDGLVNAAQDGIVAKVIDNKVDFQVEIIMDVNAISREQVSSSTGVTRTTSGGAETSVQVTGQGLTTTVEASTESGADTQTSSGTSTEGGTEGSTETSSSNESSSANQSSSGNADMAYEYVEG
jgi:hypothetical protein